MSTRLIYVMVGTLGLHVAIAAALGSVDAPDRRPERAPVVELEQAARVEPAPPPPEPPPPPEIEEEEEPEPPPPDVPQPPTARVDKQRVIKTIAPTTETDEEARPGDVVVGGGDAPVLKIDGLGSGTIAVTPGKTTPGRHGKGGSGKGSGSGSGSGSGAGSATETAVSVASIKKRAKPKGDYAYFDARKDYPEEAKRLGIEGQIKVRLTVSAKGAVTATKILTKLGHGLDELALTRAKKLEFDPALDTDDKPVASIVVWTFTFALPE